VRDRLEYVIARNLAEIRAELGWTQSDLAERMRGAGMATWQQNRVTQIETLRRPATLLEVLVLSWVTQVPLSRFFSGEIDVELSQDDSVPLSALRQIVEGHPARVTGWPVVPAALGTDELRKVAQKLDIPIWGVDWVAELQYGMPFARERERRVGDVSGLTQRSAQAKRGNATRAMISELRGLIQAYGGSERVREAYLTYLVPGELGRPEGDRVAGTPHSTSREPEARELP
jgi:transcriptional regulator with XRE-family HTH domain